MPTALLLLSETATIRMDAMRAFAFLVVILIVLWAIDAVVYDGRFGGQVYEGIHQQGQKLRAEVKQRLNTDSKT
jgi:hypothetical protein